MAEAKKTPAFDSQVGDRVQYVNLDNAIVEPTVVAVVRGNGAQLLGY